MSKYGSQQDDPCHPQPMHADLKKTTQSRSRGSWESEGEVGRETAVSQEC